MFGNSLKSKTLKVLKKDFGYPNIHSLQKPILSGIVAQAKSMGVNEYDAAIMFMMSQLGALSPVDPRVGPFVTEQLQNIERVISLALSPSADILERIEEIRLMHDLGQAYQDGKQYNSYSEWFKDFKYACAELNSQLRVGEDGKSFLDFMDQSGLQQAFEDGVDPVGLAGQFALDFDVKDVE